jgi:hypothetical protein
MNQSANELHGLKTVWSGWKHCRRKSCTIFLGGPWIPRLDLDAVHASIQQWVSDYVSLRLQQLVPETCEPVPAADPGEGPCLPGTNIRCTEEVMHL